MNCGNVHSGLWSGLFWRCGVNVVPQGPPMHWPRLKFLSGTTMCNTGRRVGFFRWCVCSFLELFYVQVSTSIFRSNATTNIGNTKILKWLSDSLRINLLPSLSSIATWSFQISLHMPCAPSYVVFSQRGYRARCLNLYSIPPKSQRPCLVMWDNIRINK